jgi:L-cysteine S-thiosulfotransferase
MKWLLLTLCASAAVASAGTQTSGLRPYSVEGDTIAASLTGQAGDPARGALLIQQRQKSLCVLCHSGPFPDPHLHGTLAPDLTGVGARLSAGQLRLRVVDMKRLNPDSIMPTYYAVITSNGAARVAAGWRDEPILSADEIEDLVAYLQTLQR